MAIMKKAALLLAPVLLGVATACAYPGCVERRDACGVYWYDSGAHTSWIPPGWIDGAELSANFTDESELVASPTDYRHLDFTAPRLLSMDPSEVWVAENRPRRCGWQIRCEGGQAAVLRFTAMNTEADVDFVSLSSQSVHTDSRNWSSPLVGVTREITHISGATVPAGVQFGASGGVLWVVFTSDGSVNGYGSFAAEYWCAAPDSVSCTDPAAVNYSPVATADDGSCMADLTVAPQTLMLTGSLRNPNEVYYFRLQPDLLNNRPHYQCARHNGTTSSSSSSSSGSCRWTNDGECDEPSLCPTGTDTADCASLYLYWSNDNPSYRSRWLFDRNEHEASGYYAALDSTSFQLPLGAGWEEYNGESFQVNPSFTLTEVQDAVWGCMDPTALNFSPVATADDSSCEYVLGCMDPTALNYSPVATANDHSCMADLTVATQTLMLTGRVHYPNDVYYFRVQPDLLNNRPHYARPNGVMYIYWGSNDNRWYLDRNEDEASGYYALLQSTSLGVPLGAGWEEYNGESFQVNPSFTLTEVQDAVWGCMDPTALNFSPVATADDGSCIADLAIAPQTLMLTGLMYTDQGYDTHYLRLQPDLLNNRPCYTMLDDTGSHSSPSGPYLYWSGPNQQPGQIGHWLLGNDLVNSDSWARVTSTSLMVPLGHCTQCRWGEWGGGVGCVNAYTGGVQFGCPQQRNARWRDNPTLALTEVSAEAAEIHAAEQAAIESMRACNCMNSINPENHDRQQCDQLLRPGDGVCHNDIDCGYSSSWFHQVGCGDVNDCNSGQCTERGFSWTRASFSDACCYEQVSIPLVVAVMLLACASACGLCKCFCCKKSQAQNSSAALPHDAGFTANPMALSGAGVLQVQATIVDSNEDGDGSSPTVVILNHPASDTEGDGGPTPSNSSCRTQEAPTHTVSRAATVRAEAAVKSREVGAMKPGQHVSILETMKKDGHVRARIGPGQWISSRTKMGNDLLVPFAPHAAVFTVLTKATVRSDASPNSKMLGTLEPGDTIVVLEETHRDGHHRARIGTKRWISLVTPKGSVLAVPATAAPVMVVAAAVQLELEEGEDLGED